MVPKETSTMNLYILLQRGPIIHFLQSFQHKAKRSGWITWFKVLLRDVVAERFAASSQRQSCWVCALLKSKSNLFSVQTLGCLWNSYGWTVISFDILKLEDFGDYFTIQTTYKINFNLHLSKKLILSVGLCWAPTNIKLYWPEIAKWSEKYQGFD